MLALLYFIFSLTASLLFLPYLIELISNEKLLVKNFRGQDVPTGGGLLFVFSMLSTVVLVAIAQALTGQRGETYPFDKTFILLVLGIGFFGLLDDLLGSREAGGFAGHLKLLLKGRLSTGLLKALGGLTLSFLAVRPFSETFAIAVLNTLIVALFINFFNLLDLRPGRALKVSLILGLAMFGGQLYRSHFDVVLFAQDENFFAPWGIFLAPAFVLLYQELKERLMLGDVGSNVVGAVTGFIFVTTFQDLSLKLVALALLLFLNVVSERFSFSSFIERTPGLKQLDELGRQKN